MGNRKRGKIKSRKPSKPAGIRSHLSLELYSVPCQNMKT